jgi:acyl-CoA thioesterase-2
VQLRFSARPVLDIRPIHSEGYFEHPAEQREIAYWVWLAQPLSSEGFLHHAVLTYMSGRRR